MRRTAEVKLEPGSDDSVSGFLHLISFEDRFGSGVLITGQIYGLLPGKHGFHVHTEGALTNMCKDAKGHFNPDQVDHMGPLDSSRHTGDLGNIETIDDICTYVHIYDRKITLGDGGKNDIAGRAIVVHEGEDDLGRGGDEGSRKTGNAGSRLACGTINLH